MSLPFKTLKLYNYAFSSSSWRVRIVLNLKKIKYEYIPINLQKGEGDQNTPAYAKINPMRQVPVLDVDGSLLTESTAICEFLETTVPEPRLIPKDPLEAAYVRAFCEMINSGIQPITNLRVLKHVQSRGIDKKDWARYWLLDKFASLDTALQSHKGKYCFGNEVTLADAYLVPQVQGTIKRFDIDIAQFTNLNEVFENLKKVQEFKDAHPLKQPDGSVSSS